MWPRERQLFLLPQLSGRQDVRLRGHLVRPPHGLIHQVHHPGRVRDPVQGLPGAQAAVRLPFRHGLTTVHHQPQHQQQQQQHLEAQQQQQQQQPRQHGQFKHFIDVVERVGPVGDVIENIGVDVERLETRRSVQRRLGVVESQLRSVKEQRYSKFFVRILKKLEDI